MRIMTIRPAGGKLAIDPEAHSVYYTEGPSGLQPNYCLIVERADEMTETATEAQSAHRMRADAQRSRAKLLTAATAAFAERGADAPLEDIAKRAGVGIGTLYRHFPTRLDLQAA